MEYSLKESLQSMLHNSFRVTVFEKKRNGVYIKLALCMMLAMTRKGSEYLGAREDLATILIS